MMSPIIFINGPPRSGKDTLANHIVERFAGFRAVKFAEVLKERTHALYGRTDLAHDAFEGSKDTPTDTFMGLTPREAYISVSEDYMKVFHGDEVFGHLLLDKLRGYGLSRAFVISDSGFVSEALPILRVSTNCILVRIHAEGRGCTFEGDSRSYISLPIDSYDFDNNGSERDFLNNVRSNLGKVFQQMIGGN